MIADVTRAQTAAIERPSRELGRGPALDEIADLTASSRGGRLIQRSAQAPISLEKPVGESPYERATETLTKEAMRRAIEDGGRARSPPEEPFIYRPRAERLH